MRVSVHIAAGAVLASTVFMLAASTPVYAAANPRNHGHHYGQLKHPKHHPGPVPVPHPSPAPAPRPVTHHSGGNTGVQAGGDTQVSLLPLSTGSTTIDQRTVPALRADPTPLPGDPLWWLVITILPTLAVAWLIALSGVVRRAARRPRAPAPSAVAATALS